jgi:hypothetical protein
MGKDTSSCQMQGMYFCHLFPVKTKILKIQIKIGFSCDFMFSEMSFTGTACCRVYAKKPDQTKEMHNGQLFAC